MSIFSPDEQERDEAVGRFAMPLVFAALTIPLLATQCEDSQQDCYRSREDCSKDWSDSSDCEQGPDQNSCPYVGRYYNPGRMGYVGGSGFNGRRTENAIGVNRGGFGSTGRGFFRGG